MSQPGLSPAVARAATVPQLLGALMASDPGRPRLTWYDDAAGPTRGERIELSARVLANWVAKAANLLVDELDVEPGDRLVVDLPPHWRSVYWLLAGWSVGADVVVDGGPGAVVVTDRPADVPAGPLVVAVTLPALARSWAGALPGGALDEAATVTGQPDVLVPTDPSSGATVIAAARAAAAAQGWATGERVLTSAGPRDAVAGLLAPLVVDGSLVLVRDPDPHLAPDRRQAERVTSDAPRTGTPASRPPPRSAP